MKRRGRPKACPQGEGMPGTCPAIFLLPCDAEILYSVVVTANAT